MSALHDTVPTQHDPQVADMLMASFRRQREAYLQAPTPDYRQRKQDLLSLKTMLSENRLPGNSMSALHDTVPTQHDPQVADMLMAGFRRQREAYLQAPTPDYRQRKQDLLSLKTMLSENREEIIAAINQDYGNRSRHETLFAEVIPSP